MLSSQCLKSCLLPLSCSCSLFSALSISTSNERTLALLLQTHTTHRIVDFIIANSEGPVVCLSVMSRTGCYLNAIFWPPGAAHIRLPSSFRCLRNRGTGLISKTVQQTKATGSSLPCLSCTRNVLAPTQHVIHSDFDFFLSYFIMFVLFLFVMLCLCVCFLICFFCVSTPPLLCLQLAL